MNNQQKLKKELNGRLSSLAASRDLNLGGAKPTKKTFAPNVNAVRNKGKAVPDLSSDGSRKLANRRQAYRDKRNEKSDGPRYVQSTGIFSEGTHMIKKTAAYSDRNEGYEPGDGPAMAKPTIDTHAEWNIDEEHETEIVNQLLLCKSASDLDLRHQPLVLPLERNKGNFFQMHAPISENKVKEETDTGGSSQPSAEGNDSVVRLLPSLATPKLYSRTEPAVSLVQLPNSMPGRWLDDDGRVIDYRSLECNEGLIGKVVLRASGKMEMVVGGNRYAMDQGECPTFEENVAVIPDEQSPRASYVNVGPVVERFVVTPMWTDLVRRLHEESS